MNTPVMEHEELDAFAGDRSFVMSFARGVSVIQAFANVQRPLTIAEISHRVQIPRAAVRRLLHTLCELGFVRMQGLRYELTPKTLELGNAFASSNPQVLGVQPLLTRLADQLKTFCAVSVPEGDSVMLMCLAGRRAMPAVARQLTPGAGSKAPLYASACGMLFLSNYSKAQLDAYFARVAMLPITYRTLTVPEQVRDSVQRAAAQGYAMGDRTFSNDVRSVAVPIRNTSGEVAAAVVAVVPEATADEATLRETVLPALRNTATQASVYWR